MNEQQFKYWEKLCEAGAGAQSEYDKAVVLLSGGALGLSLTFLKDIVKDGPVVSLSLLTWAFTAWIISLIVVLVSYASGRRAHLSAAEEYSKSPSNYDYKDAGGAANRATKAFNAISGSTCIAGLFLISMFVVNNLEARQHEATQKKGAQNTDTRRTTR